METLNLRVLPLTSGTGPEHMATDEVLLESAARGQASFRTYTWDGPTVSLGYFQSAAVRHSSDLLTPLPFVRRPSGGLLLVHHLELTYALALPAEPRWHGERWLPRMHRLIATVLRCANIQAEMHPGPDLHSDSPLCFTHHTTGDLQIQGYKVVGSAQRRYRGALLQHGAILLRRSSHTPELGGITELTGVRLDPLTLGQNLLTELVRETGSTAWPGALTTEEIRARDELIQRRYSHPAWNEKR